MESRQLLSASVDAAAFSASRGILGGARNLGSISMRGGRSTNGNVGVTSTNAVYQVNVGSAMNLSITLTKLAQTDQVHLLYADGVPVNTGWQNLKSSTLKISQRLDPGTYFIDIAHGLIASNTTASRGTTVRSRHYNLKPTDGFSLQVKGAKPDNTIAPTEPVVNTKFSSAFSSSGASSEPTISSQLASNSGFTNYQSFANNPLWGSNGPQPDDIQQRGVGDCYFLSVLSDAARVDPGWIEQSIVPQSNGDYLVKFYNGGKEYDEQVDAQLPVNSQGGLVFADVASDNAIWPAIMEKAFCYFRIQSTNPGSYDGIAAGLPSESMLALGSTDASDTLVSNFKSSSQLLSTISSELQQPGELVDVGTIDPNGWPDTQKLSGGLFAGHAYSVVQVDLGANTVELRNPWGTNTAGTIDSSGGYITLSGDQLIQSIDILSQGTIQVANPNPNPSPTPNPNPTPQPTNNTNSQTLPETLGPKSFQTSGGANFDVFTFTANSSGSAEVQVNSSDFVPELLVAQVGSNGAPISIGTDPNTSGSDIADVKFSVTGGVTYEVGVFASASSATGAYTMVLTGDLSAANQLTPTTDTGSLSGFVFDDANSDGSFNNGETGSQGWTVYLDLNNDGQLDGNDPSTTTDANGAYTFTGLSAGTYVVRVVPASAWSQTTPANNDGLSVSVSAGQNTQVDPFGETPISTGRVTGTVYNDANSDNAQDGGESGLSGWYVYIDLNNSGSYANGDPWAVTDSNGNYSIGGLLPGNYQVKIYPTTGWNTTQGQYGYSANVQAGGTAQNGNFGEVQITGDLTGAVYNDANSSGAYDSGETGLEGWQVYIDLNNSGQYVSGDPTATTDRTGTYRFTGLAPGKYIVRLVHSSAWTTTQGSSDWIATVTGGQTNNGGWFGESQVTGDLYGTVYYDSNGNQRRDAFEPSMRNWVVYIDLNNTGSYQQGDPYVYTNNYGGYEFTNLAPGQYIIREYPPSGWYATEGSRGWLATVVGNKLSFSGSFGVR